MIGIKKVAEGGKTSRLLDDVQVGLWAATFLGFIVSLGLVVAGRQPGWHLVTFVGCGLLFQLLTLLQPSPLIGLVLVLATVRPRVVAESVRRALLEGPDPAR